MKFCIIGKGAGHTTVSQVRDEWPAPACSFSLSKGGYFMKSTKINRHGRTALFLAAILTTALLFTAAVAAIEMPQGREGSFSRDSAVSDPLMGSDMLGDTEGNLGDTAPGEDSWTGENDGWIDDSGDVGMGSDAGTGLPGNDSAGDSATDTAGTSSGSTEDRGMSVFGIVITIVIIVAVVALIIALIPKKRTGA